MKIYTKKGDRGTTELMGGTRVTKSDIRLETYGTIDELNCWVGYCSDRIEEQDLKEELSVIQERLFTTGALLATDTFKKSKVALPELHPTDIKWLEEKIDAMTAQLPQMKSFILPSGHLTVSSLHIARCICRRGERLLVRLQEQGAVEDENILPYLNRLSDYLFTLARFCAHRLNVEEVKWHGAAGKPNG